MYLPKKLITAGKPVVKAVVVKAAPSALPLKEPVITIASPVIVQITIVSKKVPVIEIRPCLTAEFVLAAAAAIGGVVTSVISNQVKFEKSMDNFQAILGVSAREMEYFSQEAIRMGSTTTQTASQVAEAYTMIAARLPQLLKSKEGLVQVTEAAIILAEAAGITVDEAGKALADSINQTGASAYEASRYINVLAAGSRNGAGDITYLNTAKK